MLQTEAEIQKSLTVTDSDIVSSPEAAPAANPADVKTTDKP
jgi:hypothetical protein